MGPNRLIKPVGLDTCRSPSGADGRVNPSSLSEYGFYIGRGRSLRHTAGTTAAFLCDTQALAHNAQTLLINLAGDW